MRRWTGPSGLTRSFWVRLADPNGPTLTATSGLHVWKQRGSVLRDCRPLDADGKPILATEGEKRVRAATDALSQSKAPRVGKLRQAPEEEKFDLAAA